MSTHTIIQLCACYLHFRVNQTKLLYSWVDLGIQQGSVKIFTIPRKYPNDSRVLIFCICSVHGSKSSMQLLQKNLNQSKLCIFLLVGYSSEYAVTYAIFYPLKFNTQQQLMMSRQCTWKNISLFLIFTLWPKDDPALWFGSDRIISKESLDMKYKIHH